MKEGDKDGGGLTVENLFKYVKVGEEEENMKEMRGEYGANVFGT